MIKNKFTNINIKYLGIMVVMSFFYMLPFFVMDGVDHFSSQDTQFYLARIMGLGNVGHSPVNFQTFHHNGSMINVFYPYLTIYPAYIFTKLFGSLIVGYKVYLLVLTLATMFIAYFSMMKIKKNEHTALFFALLYTFATYRTTDIYYRQALGEGVALTLFPLVLAGMYNVFFADQKKWRQLAAGMTLLVYTHLLSVAMISTLIALFLIGSFIFWDKKRERIKMLIYATGTTIILSLGFLVPFLYRMLTNDLNTPTGINLEGIPVKYFIEFVVKNAPNGYTIGSVIFLGTLFSLLKIKKLTSFDKVSLLLGIIIVIATTTLFDWENLNKTPLITIQFVWRLNGIATLLLSYTFSIAFTAKHKESNQSKLYTMLGIVTVFHLLAMYNLYGKTDVYNYIAQKNDEIQKFDESNVEEIRNNFFTADYINEKAMGKLDNLLNFKFLVNGKEQKVKYAYTADVFTAEINQKAKKATLTMPVLYYKHQTIMVNGKEIHEEKSDSGLTEITIPKGKSIIEISYHYLFIEKLAKTLSLAALIFILLWQNEQIREKLLLVYSIRIKPFLRWKNK